MNQQIKTRIELLKKQGYELRFPGGKSRDGSFACFGIFARAEFHKGKIQHEVLVIPYKIETKGIQGGEEEKIFFETPEQTLEREILEEIGALINRGAYHLMNSVEVDDNRPGYEGKKHVKYAYFVSLYDMSNLRTKPSPFQKNIGIPLWVPLTPDLERYVSASHQWILKDTQQVTSKSPVLKTIRKPYKPRKKNHLLPATA